MEIRDRIKELRRVKASELRPNPKNWRTHPANQQDAMKAILAEIGYADALLAREMPDGTLMLVDGHLRAETTPDSLVPVLILDLDEAEADKLLATLDPLASLADSDAGKLEALLKTVDTDSEALQALLDSTAKDAGLEEAEVVEDEPPAVSTTPPVAARGDLWLLGEHRLMCGDSTDAGDVGRLMGGEMVDCVFTSPPYAVGIDYGDTYEDSIENLRAMLPALSKRWLEVVLPGGFAVINFGDVVSGRKMAGTEVPCEYPMALEYWPVFRADGWVLWSRRVWCKPVARVAAPWCASSNRSATNYEHVWTWKAEGDPIVGRIPGPMDSQTGWFDTSNLEGVDVGKDTHGAGMPVSTAAWMLNVHSRLGSSVHEPFTGTGTTLIAAEQLGRKCYGMEISPQYCDVIIKRWEKLTGKQAKREDGATFADLIGTHAVAG